MTLYLSSLYNHLHWHFLYQLGSALYIETQAIRRGKDSEGKGKGGGMLKVTGQLGKVMEESTQIAYTVARSRIAEVDYSSSYFDDNDIHMHVPEGATPKDGPSAGITMTTSMLSLALDKPIRNDLAMTGRLFMFRHYNIKDVLSHSNIQFKIHTTYR